MWKKATNDKYGMVARKMVNWAKVDQLAKCIYFVCSRMGSSFPRLTSSVVWDWITIWVYWQGIDTFSILVLDSYVGIMALY